MRTLLMVLGLTAAATAQAWAQTETRSMSFDACLQAIRGAASDLGVAPINIVETNDLRVVRFPTRDGSVLISCSRPDGKMVVTKSK